MCAGDHVPVGKFFENTELCRVASQCEILANRKDFTLTEAPPLTYSHTHTGFRHHPPEDFQLSYMDAISVY